MLSNYDDEMYFCGSCQQQYPATGSNEKCSRCGTYTVSWYINRETATDAMKKWKVRNGK